MTIQLNGEPLEVASDATLASIVAETGAAGQRRGVAVAVDGEVVPRSEWDSTGLSEGQRIEVVGAIQGG